MSKFRDIFLPAFGGTALIIGLAYGFSSRDYASDRIELLEDRVAEVESQASAAVGVAEAEADRAAQLAEQMAAAQAAAEERAASGVGLTGPAPQADGRYGLGRTALTEELAAWDVDVLPDGRGLPEGRGDVMTGEEVFADKCAACHGDFAEGVDNWPPLAGGFDTLHRKDPVKTVGSFWPYLSTVWDYVHRSMPFGGAGTLTADETYAIVAYILYSNDLVDDEFELSRENFTTVEMYNTDGFILDDRPEQEYAEWRTEPCMENCKDSVQITMRATFLDVTPDDGGASVMNDATTGDTPTFTATTAAAAGAESTAAGAEVVTAAADPELMAAGEKVFRKCAACHAVGEGAKNKTGPQLNGVIGRTMGAVDGFGYSSAFQAAHDEGRVWDEAAMAEFLAQPRDYMNGTKMAFAGLKKQEEIAAIMAYLKSHPE